MFFVFHFLVFAYSTLSEINCLTQGSIRTTNYVRKHEEIYNLRGATQHKDLDHKTNKINNDLKSNVFDKILTDEMLEQRYYRKDSSLNPLPLSSKHHLVTPTLEIKQKWPMFKYPKNVKDVGIENHNKRISLKITNDDEYLDPLPVTEINSDLKVAENKIEELDVSNHKKVPWIKQEITKTSKFRSLNNKVGMRSLSETGVREKCKKTNPSNSCQCSGTSHSKKRCTHATPNAKVHECSRYGATVTNHSCSQNQNQPFQNFVTSNPYSFYPVYVPYTYFASEAPMIPYTISYPQPILSDLKIPRKHKHKCRKHTTRFDDDLYYEDNSRERRPYDDSEYYQDSKKESTKGIVYDVNQDALIKEIVKDLKIHNNKDFVKECYCDSSLSTCRSNIFVLIITLACLDFLSTMLCFGLE